MDIVVLMKSCLLSVQWAMPAKFLGFFLIMTLSGCVAELPVYEWRNLNTAVDDLQQRSQSVRSASGSGAMILRRSDGESVQIECAFAMALPDQLRIRSWKFNRAVADWTITPQGTWIWQEGEKSDSQTEKLREFWASSCTGMWPVLFGMLLSDSQYQASDLDRHQFQVTQPCDEHELIVVVDKRHLLIRECRVETRQGKLISSVKLEEYRMIGEIPWPTKVTATASGASFILACSDVSLNEPLAPAAFAPPRRAEKVR